MNLQELNALLNSEEVRRISEETYEQAKQAGIRPIMTDYGVFAALGHDIAAYTEYLISREDFGEDVPAVAARMETFHKEYQKLK